MFKGYSDRQFLKAIESGEVQVVEKCEDDSNGNTVWKVNIQVKEKILEVFKNNEVIEMNGFCDKLPLSPRYFTLEDSVRVVPGGSSVRSGAYIGRNVVIMPPSYINIGAYVDDLTMVDSHVLVGSCARIGKNVHLSAGVQIGGVLEPVRSAPVIIEDNCFIGAGSTVTEGVLVRSYSVLAAGVNLTASTPIYDLVNKMIYKGEVPKCAVVIPGTRAIKSNEWAKEHALSLTCAIIVKYSDDKTKASVALEDLLR